jgi:hypothetical protein
MSIEDRILVYTISKVLIFKLVEEMKAEMILMMNLIAVPMLDSRVLME